MPALRTATRIIILTLVFGTGATAAVLAQEGVETENAIITPEAASLEAARTGDVEEMRRLRGSSVELSGEVVETLRDTKGYLDVIVATGPDFKVAGGRTGFEIVVRIPATLREDELDPLIDATGSITDFEPSRFDDGRLHWRPVVTIDFLK